ncbi:phosphonate C-P lyase system protein PhnH [Dendrosporobacter sp. 1207_IL3150]|uniref:phosphonate C-P lyase system protein PhnH n=1 Tax=Dendrosporobacter sp. 1207_IL3150 TaxID=3084054 RepID=UPI002FDA4E8C
MELDMTHDIQSVFRKLLNCMSRPGLIENISTESQKIDINIDISSHLLTVLFTVLDGEVSFDLMALNGNQLVKKINQLTYAKNTAIQQADYIIVTKTADQLELLKACGKAKVGTLIDPHKSATLIMEVEEIFAAQQLVLTGPGIERESYVSVSGSLDWIGKRMEKNIEFPLGIDMIIVDGTGNIICLPRTTKIAYQGG